MNNALVLAGVLVMTAPAGVDAPTPWRWGPEGHEMAARAAATRMPRSIPRFFRRADDQLIYLNPEPDRWRNRELTAMDQAWSYDHYIDLENVQPADALDEPDRYSFMRRLRAAGIERPEQDVGFLPYRIMELYERLVTEWRLWREDPSWARRDWIEERIIADAGILGHYVTDAANPHHSTIHFNGWNADSPNPEGYTVDREFHNRFESLFVRAHVDPDAVRDRVTGEPRSVVGDVWPAIIAHIQESNGLVETLYKLDRDVGFDPDAPAGPDALDFVIGRLAAGAEMLRVLWWSAWLESASTS